MTAKNLLFSFAAVDFTFHREQQSVIGSNTGRSIKKVINSR